MAQDNDPSINAAPRSATGLASNHPRLSFLGLPAEIRNRIYYFADEEADKVSGKYLPLLARQDTKQWPIEDCALSCRKFYGLTQACRQVRFEYFPIWRRTSSVRIRPCDFDSFAKEFYGDEHGAYGPKLLQLSWKHRAYGETDLLPHIRFRMAHSNTALQYVSDALINWPKLYGSTRRRRRGRPTQGCGFECRSCGHKYEGLGSSMCSHQSITFQGRKAHIAATYRFLREFNRIINHKDQKFEEEVSKGCIHELLGYSFPGGDYYIRVVILPSGFSTEVQDDGWAPFAGNSNDAQWRTYFEAMGIRSPEFCPWNVFLPKGGSA